MTIERKERILKHGGRALLVVALGLAVLSVFAGCAATVDQMTGDLIWGFKVAAVVETANQAGYQLAGQIPYVGGTLQSAMLTASAGGVGVGSIMRLLSAKLEGKRKRTDQQREAAEKRVAELEAELAAVRPPVV